jgi:hypothetical protein
LLQKSQPKERDENFSLPTGDPPALPNDVSPVATSSKSVVTANNVVVEPILEEIDSDVEGTPAKVINEAEWNAEKKMSIMIIMTMMMMTTMTTTTTTTMTMGRCFL